MTLTIHPNLIQGSEEWLEQRRGMVTASIVGALITTRRLGAIDYDCPECAATANDPCRSLRKPTETIKTLHPARAEHAKRQPSPIVIEPASNDMSRSLTAKLVAERVTGWIEDCGFISNDMMRGIEHEPIARARYAEVTGYTVTEIGFMIRDDIKCGYSPDGLVGEEGLLEVKCPRAKTHMQTIISGAVPIEHMAQCQAGLLVSGRKWLDYVSFVGGMPLYVRRVFPQQKWFDAIIAAVRAFEDNAAELMRIYDESIAGLHPTERIIEQEITI